jgi:hypothetical protein
MNVGMLFLLLAVLSFLLELIGATFLSPGKLVVLGLFFLALGLLLEGVPVPWRRSQ